PTPIPISASPSSAVVAPTASRRAGTRATVWPITKPAAAKTTRTAPTLPRAPPGRSATERPDPVPQGAVGGPVHGHDQDTHPVHRLGQGPGQVARGADPSVLDPVGGAEGSRVGAVRGAEEPLRDGGGPRGGRPGRLAVLQGGEDAAPVVIDHHDGQVRDRL